MWLVLPYALIAASVLIAWSSRGPLLELKAGREAGAKVSTADLEREMRSMRPKVELTPEMKELDVSAEGIAIERAPRRRRLGRGPDAVADAAAYNANMSALKAALLDGYDTTSQPEDLEVQMQMALLVFPAFDRSVALGEERGGGGGGDGGRGRDGEGRGCAGERGRRAEGGRRGD